MKKAVILTRDEILRAIKRISHEILEKNKGAERLAIIGIRTRGYFIAERIRSMLRDIDDVDVPVGALDITLYRDDLTARGQQPVVQKTEIEFDIEDKDLILVDDVLYTGRTIRSALDALIDLGRPRSIQLAVLVDRGHRELPIRADYVGKNVPTSRREAVEVRLGEIDGEDEVFIADYDQAR